MREGGRHQHPRHVAVNRRAAVRFWILAFLVSILAVGLLLALLSVFGMIGDSRHTRYEPVDVPPASLSPRHEREREEVTRQEKSSAQKTR